MNFRLRFLRHWFDWFKTRKQLIAELSDERASIVSVECAIKPQCREHAAIQDETITTLRAANESLRTLIDTPKD